jgi:hypothetical protein
MLVVQGSFAREAPIDMFLELVPSLQLMSSSGFCIDAGIGAAHDFILMVVS